MIQLIEHGVELSSQFSGEILETSKKKKSIFNVIISHLSNDTKVILNNHIENASKILKRPLLNYVGFCKYLNSLYLNK